MKESMLFADTLRRYMKLRGYSVERLAEKAELDPSTLERWRGGKTRPRWKQVVRVAAALDLTKAQTNALLRSAGHRPVEDLLDQPVSEEDRALLVRWTATTLSNLPGHLTNFFGREEEMYQIASLLDTARLVTLTGPGGSGKTRLALEAAESVLDAFPDGAFFVRLSSISDPALVIPTISRELGVPEAPREPAIETLKVHLRDKQVLLLLDNFEQVLGAAPLVVELLWAAPRIKVLATSRIRLHIYGEHEYLVAPLPSPDPSTSLSLLRTNPAVALFVDRARAARFGFVLTPENAPDVANICARLDGLPLAIELAAPRVAQMSPGAMLEHFPGRLDIGREGPRGVPRRQQTLRASIGWSYDLLSPGEQQLFRRLAVFSGGCSEEAVKLVCRNLDSTPQTDVSAGLYSLVESNLLRLTMGVEDELRFEMLETIREYALERLRESGELEGAQRAHAEYYLGLAETAESEFDGPAQTYWLDRLELEHANFRAALGWYRERGEAYKGLRLSTALISLWEQREYYVEGHSWLQAFLDNDHEFPLNLHAKALLWSGLLLMRHANDPAGAAPVFERALALYRESGNLNAACETLQAQGDLALKQGDTSTARDRYEESLEVARKAGDSYLAHRACIRLSQATQETGDWEQVERYAERALEYAHISGNKGSVAWTHNMLGEVARHRRDRDKARYHYQKCLDLARESDTEWLIAIALHNLGYVACYREEYDVAFGLFSESLLLYEKRLNKKGIGECLAGMAKVAASQQLWERAAQLCGASEKVLASIGSRLDRLDRADYEQTVSLARCKLGDERFEVLRAEGRMMSPEWAVEYALHR